MWTQFWDMHSGGGQKEKWAKIYIEAPMEEAKVIFYNRFGHSAERVTCTCCGEDYSLSEDKSLAQLTGYHRNCAYSKKGGYLEKQNTEYLKYVGKPTGIPSRDKEREQYIQSKKYMTLKQYCARKDVKVIRAKDIKPGEKQGDVPRQGFIWVE